MARSEFKLRSFTAAFVAILLVGLCARRDAWAVEPISFKNQIGPILLENCTSCHGPKKAEGGYRLDTFTQLSKAGDSGIMPLATQDGLASELLRRLKTDEEGERMPAERPALSSEMIGLVEKWLSEGAKFDFEDPQAPLFEIAPTVTYGPAPEIYNVPLPITALTFSPDGLQIVAGGYHELTVWDVASGELKRRITNMPERIYCLQWSADKRQLAVAGGAPGRIGEVRVIDWDTGIVKNSFGRTSDVIQAVQYQPNGRFIATGNTDGTVRWFDIESGKQIRSLAGHADSVNALSWSSDGKRIASASRDKTAKVFDVESGELLATYSGHGEPVTGICFNEGDKELTSVGTDKKVHRWQIEEAKRLAAVAVPERVTRLVQSGSHAWLGLTDRTVRQLELAGSKLVKQLDGHSDWVTSIGIHSESNRMASGSLNGEVRVWNLQDGTSVKNWIAAPAPK